MPIIKLQTFIHADISIVFDLARSIDLHLLSTKETNERAIAGKTSGLIELGESVTWRAKHFGVYQELSSKITAFNPPYFFEDTMVKGAFKSFTHQHIFERTEAKTLMKDVFEFEAPLGILGTWANKLFLVRYLTQLLEKRNAVIKEAAESEQWKEILS